jgi:glycine/D-amino acid oxidase-like deaminating enzyme
MRNTMDLTSDLPFWTVRNGLMHIYPPLEENLSADALVIGGGISGALLAHELITRGVDCVLIDRRDIGQGSTSASTALLQYEIDTPLFKLRKQVGCEAAERAYCMGIDAIHHLQRLAGADCGFKRRPSLQIATRKSDVAGLQKEYTARHRINLSVVMMDRRDLRQMGISGTAALRSAVAAEVDPYRFTHRLLRLASRRGLRVFDRTAALRYESAKQHVTVFTDRLKRIKCKAVFFATGYETRDILPKNLVKFKSTYAFISEPLANLGWWKDRALIWGTGDPYPYMRTTSDNRVIVGGEDDKTLDAKRRDKRIGNKTIRLAGRFNALFPGVRLEPAFAWAGTFGSTKDGLGYIGPHPCFPRAYFALGFGGNGITFSEIASRILADLFLGTKTSGEEKIFRFDR